MTYSVYHITVNPGRGWLLNDGYIGISNNPSLRFNQHLRQKTKSNLHLKNALKKYENLVSFVVIADNLDYEAACLVEEMLRPSANMGWNIAKGGDVPPSPKGKQRSSSYRENISKSKLGSKNPMFGKKVNFSSSHREKLSKAITGIKRPHLQGIKRKTIICPYCNTFGGVGPMNRWHFENCKLKHDFK